ncbi:MAG: hypothetical protein KKA36_02265 [Gammaproteobacteria bacterium]|nr:hypothetical protein [Gammaproteobacteria bacterium]MBU2477887.1 hypothetical protein [Gammaproteobacteria bacterium]
MSGEFKPEEIQEDLKEAAEDVRDETVAAAEGIADALRQGASDAAKSADHLLPKVGNLVSKAIYSTCYYGSYGVVFAALTVARILPKDSTVIHGLEDGADAARQAIEKAEVAATDMPLAEPAGMQA